MWGVTCYQPHPLEYTHTQRSVTHSLNLLTHYAHTQIPTSQSPSFTCMPTSIHTHSLVLHLHTPCSNATFSNLHSSSPNTYSRQREKKRCIRIRGPCSTLSHGRYTEGHQRSYRDHVLVLRSRFFFSFWERACMYLWFHVGCIDRCVHIISFTKSIYVHGASTSPHDANLQRPSSNPLHSRHSIDRAHERHHHTCDVCIHSYTYLVDDLGPR